MLPQKKSAGYILLEALISVVIISIGVLGMVKLQGEIIANNTESKFRINATLYANELLSMAIADSANAGCYETPVSDQTNCSNPTSKSFTEAWEQEVNNVFPGSGFNKVVSTAGANNRFTVTISWRKKMETVTHNYSIDGQLGL